MFFTPEEGTDLNTFVIAIPPSLLLFVYRLQFLVHISPVVNQLH